MNFFLVSGPRDSGKTTQIIRLFEYLQTKGWAVKHYYQRVRKDFQAVLQNRDGEEIILHSDTDLQICINHLCDYLKLHPNAGMVITSCRNDPDGMREYLFDTLDIQHAGNFYWELQMGRMPKGIHHQAAIDWFQKTAQLTAEKILSGHPFNI